jgi:serine/threonine protein kinase
MTPDPELLERLRAAAAGEYEIERQVGAGGMATVYLARDIALDRPVAINVMRPELIDVERVQDRFIIEARTAAKLGHPGIVTVYGIKSGAGLLYIVMRYVDGRTVDELLRERLTIDPATTAAIVSRVADALHFAHERGVIHRDIKPSNIIIDLAGQPVVTDFGIARVSTSQGITMAGSMLGTPLYMSPEQCRGLPVTTASDQYSLGIMSYQMLTGRTPFSGDFFELIEAHKNQAAAPLGQIIPGLDPILELTMMRMLAKDPAERWGSLAEVSQRLMMTTASPREMEQMQATKSFFAAARASLTPAPSLDVVDRTPPPTRVDQPAPVPPPTPEPSPRETPPPIMASVPAPPVAQPDQSYVPEPDQRGLGRVFVGGAALLAVIMITFTAIWSQRSAKAGATVIPAEVARDTQSLQPIVTPASSSPPRDSVVDSVKAPAADSMKAPRAASTPSPTGTKVPTKVAAPVKGRRDSVTVDCARLLERVSLGEKLTEAEQATLNARCRR